MIYKNPTFLIMDWNSLTILPLLVMLMLLFSCDRSNSLSNAPQAKMVNQVEDSNQEVFNKGFIQPGKIDTFKNGYNINEQAFDVQFQIDQIGGDQYNLVATILLDDGAYIVSPFSKDSTYGHFYFTIEDTKYLISDNQLLEIPKSVEEYDPIIEAPVNFVRVNTTYQQKLKLINQEDFEVAGLVEFLLEPICIPYDVEFKLTYQNGKMKVEKTKTVISSEYKM